jgi:hypothetical protein
MTRPGGANLQDMEVEDVLLVLGYDGNDRGPPFLAVTRRAVARSSASAAPRRRYTREAIDWHDWR